MTEADEIAQRIVAGIDLSKIRNENTLYHLTDEVFGGPMMVGYTMFDNVLEAVRQLWLNAGGGR